jgi:hypothetical protein
LGKVPNLIVGRVGFSVRAIEDELKKERDRKIKEEEEKQKQIYTLLYEIRPLPRLQKKASRHANIEVGKNHICRQSFDVQRC